jgi:predicted RNA-binding Zn ribbon-like protein
MRMRQTSDEANPEQRFPMFGGRPCLNLIATLGRRHAQPVERLPDSEALAAWLVAMRLLPPDSAVPVTARQLRAVRELREVAHRLVRATMAGQVLRSADVARLNKVAARPDLAPQLRGGADEQCHHVVRWGEQDPVDATLATLARDVVLLLSDPRTSRIKQCEHPDCSLLFFDDSQSGKRRWCSMDRCGNLMKIAGYRQRPRP